MNFKKKLKEKKIGLKVNSWINFNYEQIEKFF